MSLFRKPKKTIQRRIFTANEDESGSDQSVSMDDRQDDIEMRDTKPEKKDREKKKDKKNKPDDTKPKSSLLSFADDEEDDGEVFQVKKSSQSKKMMRMLDKERRKKKLKEEKVDNGVNTQSGNESTVQTQNINSDKIQTEIRTDDFVLVVKKSEPDNIILNGRAALCAGKDDMSSDEDEETVTTHKFAKPDNFKFVLESGSIPDAAMIHAARKRRQKAREQGDFIPIEENRENNKKGKRLVREDGDDDGSDEERVDMNAITGVKEREERREKFYSVQEEGSGAESDLEMNEWENQQIRKGVTGAQLVTAQQESVLSQFMIKSGSSYDESVPKSTATLLEQAYAKNCLEKPRKILLSSQVSETKSTSLRTPAEISDTLRNRLTQLRELHKKHKESIDNISTELQSMKLSTLNYEQKAPVAAAKYRFYQELRGYVTDLVECLDEKVPQIHDLEKRSVAVLSKLATLLIERRRQDVTDQAKEVSESCKSTTARKAQDDEHVRRAAEREGRRTRRRCDREKNDFAKIHLDGMSSDDELPDQELALYKNSLDQIEVEASDLFEDTCDDFCRIDNILMKFNVWRMTDMESYKDAFVNLCLPKILGILIRVEMVLWYPLGDTYQEIERMEWYSKCMGYGYSNEETEDTLASDPDVRLVPTLVEKVVLPKVTEIINNCWDPLSSTQTLRLLGLIRRLVRDYPSLKQSSKCMQTMFTSIFDRMKNSLDNDVFIPIFPKQFQEAKTSFFQRQFCSALKFFRNILSWQGILADHPVKELAISSLLNKYLLSAMRVCSPNDAITKAYIIVNTLPTAWLQPESEILQNNLQLLISFLKHTIGKLDKRNPLEMGPYDKAKQILQRLHVY